MSVPDESAAQQNPSAIKEIEDVEIICVDCRQMFVWTVGEQCFFRDKCLENPPKRCKECKKAKTKRLEAIENAALFGKRQRIEIQTQCANCDCNTTVPFYPSQGRPVYCRACFLEINLSEPNGASENH